MIQLLEIYNLDEASYPLKSPDGVEFWDHLWKIGKSEFETMKKTWDSRYTSEVKQTLDTQIQRLVETMRTDDHLKFKDIKLDGHIKLMRLPFEDVKQRGDYRYDSSDLAKVVENGKDLVPIAVGAKSKTGPYWVFDGHHRLRAYKIADKPVLAFVVWTEPKRSEFAQFHIDLRE